jgi:Fe-S-cluster containining protein
MSTDAEDDGLPDGVAELARLHQDVSAQVRSLTRWHGDRLRCAPGCSACCRDGLTVFAVEAALVVRRHADLLGRARPHPPGACALLDAAGRCRIYADRPYVCRTQGLPLRWLEGDAEYRDICPLNEPGPSVTELPAARCWTIGPAETALQRCQRAHRPEQPLARVALRELFPVRAGPR